MISLDWPFLIFLFCVSFGTSALLILRHHRSRYDLVRQGDLTAVQALHCNPTPRVGGLGIMLAVLVLLLPPGPACNMCLALAATLFPVFLAGLAEDLGHRTSPRIRLLAALISAGLGVMLLQAWIPPVGIAVFDVLLSVPLIAIILTLTLSAGICHGFNLIDGVNGLASSTAIMIALGLWWVSLQMGDQALAHVTMALVPAITGFLVLNWPWGRVFLGDAGAYLIGHMLVWSAILLAWQSPDISFAALSLMFFWPVADTLLAIWRRWCRGLSFDVPDRLHFHQLVYELLDNRLSNHLPRLLINSLTGLVLVPFVALPVLTAIVLLDRPLLAVMAWAGFGALFVGSYVVAKNRLTQALGDAEQEDPA
jgi:UDP-GlcNAc:undecaprenyl-phosphate/decaprenyl-phosphate GlcNAc-1-phosphate transferase